MHPSVILRVATACALAFTASMLLERWIEERIGTDTAGGFMLDIAQTIALLGVMVWAWRRLERQPRPWVAYAVTGFLAGAGIMLLMAAARVWIAGQSIAGPRPLAWHAVRGGLAIAAVTVAARAILRVLPAFGPGMARSKSADTSRP